MLRLFLRFDIEKIAKFFKTKATAKIITSLLFMVVFIFVGFGIYAFFISGFRFINIEAVEDIRLALTLYLYEIFLLILAGIVVFSSMVTGLFNLFRASANNWIMSTPAYKVLPKYVLLKSLAASSMPTLVMFIPAILAFNRVYGLGFLSLVCIVLSVVLFLLILNALTLLSILGIGSLYYSLTQKFKRISFTFKGLIIALLGTVAIIVASIWKMIVYIDLIKLFKADEDSEVLSITNISSHFNFLPTHPFAMEIVNLQNGNLFGALENIAVLALMGAFFTFIWWKISHVFYPLWQKLQEGSSQKDTKGEKLFGPKMVYHFTGSKMLALFKKEALVSSRNMKGVLWFFFLLLIWLVEIEANVILGRTIRTYQPDISARIALLQAFQFIIAIYFICAFTLRFVFPSFSVEKKTAWILASAPLSFKRIFLGKLAFYTSFFIAVGVLMSYINALVLHVSFTNALYSMVLLVLVIICIVTFGLSLGALFPSTETDDPEVISTSMSGLFFTGLSLMYGSLSAWLLYIALTKGTFVYVAAFGTVTILLILAFVIAVPRFINKRQFK